MNDVMKFERDRIARELHDRLGQTLTSLKMDLAWIRRRLGEESTSITIIDQRLVEMMHSVDFSVDEIRAITYALKAPALHPNELGAAIESHVRTMAGRGGLLVFCDVDHELRLTAEQSLQIFRIAQESITNILRHAQASSIWLSLQSTPSGIELRIRDDGRGIPSSRPDTPHGTLGLNGMAERAQFLGARLTIEPAPQGGTLVQLILPHRGSGHFNP